MDIKELDKKQLILLTLLITFVVSIATGIVTVSLMSQMPKAVPQTINNVIQRTIEKVSTVETKVGGESVVNTPKQTESILGSGDAMVSIYSISNTSVENISSINPSSATSTVDSATNISTEKELGQGIIISDVGLVLVDSSILNESPAYKIILGKIDFNATVLKKFNNGFTVLKISEKKSTVETPSKTDTTKATQ